MIAVGQTLPNGARVLAVVSQDTGTHVLADWAPNAQPYVTWTVGPDGNTYHGHYFNDYAEARINLAQRAGLSH